MLRMLSTVSLGWHGLNCALFNAISTVPAIFCFYADLRISVRKV
jgi:hypothetical protein